MGFALDGIKGTLRHNFVSQARCSLSSLCPSKTSNVKVNSYILAFSLPNFPLDPPQPGTLLDSVPSLEHALDLLKTKPRQIWEAEHTEEPAKET